MRILHSYCLNYNLGDHALGLGVKALLRSSLPVELIAETNLQGTRFDDYFIDVVNRNYDLLVIGGGGIIHGRHWPNGWFWLIDEDKIRQLAIPFVVYGAGYNYFRGEEEIPPRGIEHLRETAARARFFSVRNDGSLERLYEQTGIEAREVPDPGFSVGLGRTFQRPLEECYVLIQLAGDKPEHRYGSAASMESFVASMRIVVEQIARTRTVILAPHVLADVELCNRVAEGIAAARIWPFGDFAFDRATEAVAYYKYAEFVLAMRGHGQIIPLSFGVPVITLENHDKNRGLMSRLELDGFGVDVRDDQFLGRCLALCEEVAAKTGSLRSRISLVNDSIRIATEEAMRALRVAVLNPGAKGAENGASR